MERLPPESAVSVGPVGEVEKQALLNELQRLYSRLTPASTGATLNAASSIAVAAGAIAATQVAEAFVSIPLFWSAWLIHSLVLDLEALKDSAHLKWLEDISREVLGLPIFVSESALTRRSGRRRPLVFYASFAYSALLTIGSWGAAVWLLADRGHHIWAWASASVAVAVLVVCLWTIARRSAYAEDYEVRLPQIALSPASGHSDSGIRE